jgi:hypothetical protein
MNPQPTRRRIASAVIFTAGVLLSTALFVLVLWPDFEASLLDPAIRQDAPLRTLRCPVMLTKAETGTVSAAFKNRLQRPATFHVRAHISQGYVTWMREIDASLPLAPGETQRLQWPIAPDDAAFGRLILVKVTVRGGYPLPTRQGTCGVLVIPAPSLAGHPWTDGDRIFAFGLAVGWSLLITGIGLRGLTPQPVLGEPRRWAISFRGAGGMGLLTGCIILGTIVSLLGQWILGSMIFVITLLLLGAILEHFSKMLIARPEGGVGQRPRPT